jgi:hypothetical protein
VKKAVNDLYGAESEIIGWFGKLQAIDEDRYLGIQYPGGYLTDQARLVHRGNHEFAGFRCS